MHLRLITTNTIAATTTGRQCCDSTLQNHEDVEKDVKSKLLSQQIQQQLQQKQMTAAVTLAKGTWTKKLFLWTILLIQFAFILCFWLIQLGITGKLNESSLASKAAAAALQQNEQRVHFVQTSLATSYAAAQLQDSNKLQQTATKQLLNFKWPARDYRFQDNFQLQQNKLNVSEAEKVMFGDLINSLWCFKEGTVNKSQSRSATEEQQESADISSNDIWEEPHCQCQPEWHGRDCGQPEVIWRALMASKLTFHLQDPTRDESHRLVYMIDGPLFSLDLLELQIKSIDMVVDYFIINFRSHLLSSNANHLKALKFRLKHILPLSNFIIYQCKLNCSSAAETYRLFRQQQLKTNAIKPTDILIYTDDATVLGHRALNFLKYYAKEPPLIQFRLKFNVYGFYWQHPDQTCVNGVITTFQNLDLGDKYKQIFKARHLAVVGTLNRPSHFIVGDLNHFGGWFCKYCQQPDEIINELQHNTNSLAVGNKTVQLENNIEFPKDKKHSSSSFHIDVDYVQKLIASGMFLGHANTQLAKVHRYADKYYAPQYASEQSWKYGHLLVNIYESLEDLLADENEDEM